MKKIYLPILLLASSIFLPVNAEGGCSNYYGRGMEIIRDEEGEKFFATAEVSVPIDDRDLYLDSFEEAEMEAKNMIAKFLNEDASGSDDRTTQTDTKIVVDGETKSRNSSTVKTKLKVLSSRTPQTRLRGVTTLGSCYDPGEAVRVSVGWKLEDLDTAEKAFNAMSQRNPMNNYESRKIKSSGSSGTAGIKGGGNINFSPVPGYSDTRRIKDF